jgi:hypothetical protein
MLPDCFQCAKITPNSLQYAPSWSGHYARQAMWPGCPGHGVSDLGLRSPESGVL